MLERTVTKTASRKPQSRQGLIRNVLISLAILGVGVGGYAVYGKKAEVPTDTSVDPSASGVAVQTVEVRAWDLPFHIEVDGEASTYRIVTVGAEVAGRIVRKHDASRNGMFVHKGTELMQIDPLNYRLDVERLQARLQQADEELRSLDVDLANAQAMRSLAEEETRLQAIQLQRLKSLFERRATSENEVDNATRQELVARNALQTQQNLLNSLAQQKRFREAARNLAAAELERAQADLARCLVYAPISGRVVDDLIEEGDFVGVGDPLMHLSDSSRMEIKCSLRGEEVAWVWLQPQPDSLKTAATAEDPSAQGMPEDPFRLPRVPCEVVFEFDGVESIWDGYLDRYEGTGIDRQTRMFPCRIVVDKPEQNRPGSSVGGKALMTPPTLLSGMYVTVRIPIISPAPLLQVPVEAVRPGGQLWVVRDGVLQIVYATLARVDRERALIRQEGEALRAGDRVVISPMASVVNGMQVQDLSQTAPASDSQNGLPTQEPTP